MYFMDWKKKLAEEQYRVLREKGTEAPFTGRLLHNKDTGTYTCAGCGAEIFESNKKFDSGVDGRGASVRHGWPSFWDAKKDAVDIVEDRSHGMVRKEVLCKKCGGHLGHVFDDGPLQVNGKKATGLRYCINSCALEFEKKK